MGHKYSSVYNHNTNAQFGEFQSFQQYKWSTYILNLYQKLGKEKCTLIKRYPGKVRCKICERRMDDQPVIMIKCRLNHRYHTECFELNNLSNSTNYDKCNECEKIRNN